MKRGFPRPRMKASDAKSYPAPYSASDESLSLLGEGRHRECLTFFKCLVCGEVVEDEEVFCLVQPDRVSFLFSESGPFHENCLTITMRMCPHIRDSMGAYQAATADRKALQHYLRSYL